MNLMHYIQGRRKGKEAHRIEREAMQDAFLREALEGFEAVEGDHAAAIRRMQQQIAGRSHPKGRSITLWLSIAASVALVIGFGWYFLLHETPQTPVLSEATPAESPVDSIKQSGAIVMTKQTLSQKPGKDQMQQHESPAPPTPPVVADMQIMEAEAMEETGTETPVEPDNPKMEESSKELQKTHPTVTESLQGRVAGVRVKEASSTKAALRVHGKLVDESGDPIPGVNITVKNRKAGVVTDAQGSFALNVDDSTTLQASFTGYQTQQIKADTSQLLIVLHEDTRQLNELVVVGYSTTTKRAVNDSVFTFEETEPQAIVPEPAIGQSAYKKYLKENLIAPTEGECSGVKGKVLVRFRVDARGRPYNLRISRKLCDAADLEAMRLITEGCNWTQGNTEVTVTVEF